MLMIPSQASLNLSSVAALKKKHLDSQQLSIRFTMETENDNEIAFLDA